MIMTVIGKLKIFQKVSLFFMAQKLLLGTLVMSEQKRELRHVKDQKM